MSKNSSLYARRKIARAAWTPEQKTAHYLRYKHHRADPIFCQAAGQQHRIKRKYPAIFAVSDVKGTRVLEAWIKERWHQPCKYCGNPSDTLDHIIPVVLGGSHCWANLQLICWFCNNAKYDLLEEEFLIRVRRLAALL